MEEDDWYNGQRAQSINFASVFHVLVRLAPITALIFEMWATLVVMTYNVFLMDDATFRVRARLMHRSDMLYEDAMIAATAMVHRLVVVTRNVGNFAQTSCRSR